MVWRNSSCHRQSAWSSHDVSFGHCSPRGGHRLTWVGQETNTQALTARHRAATEKQRKRNWKKDTKRRRSMSLQIKTPTLIRSSEVQGRMVLDGVNDWIYNKMVKCSPCISRCVRKENVLILCFNSQPCDNRTHFISYSFLFSISG